MKDFGNVVANQADRSGKRVPAPRQGRSRRLDDRRRKADRRARSDQVSPYRERHPQGRRPAEGVLNALVARGQTPNSAPLGHDYRRIRFCQNLPAQANAQLAAPHAPMRAALFIARLAERRRVPLLPPAGEGVGRRPTDEGKSRPPPARALTAVDSELTCPVLVAHQLSASSAFVLLWECGQRVSVVHISTGAPPSGFRRRFFLS